MRRELDIMLTATPVRALPNPYWVNEWITNPNNRKSLSFIAQTTKAQVDELASKIPDITMPWDQVPLMSKSESGENEIGLDGPMVGAVVGAVQSGKTASMVGLISHLYDKGYDAVVVLTGTKNDLNLQTAIRLKNDVFDYGQEVLAEKSPHHPEYCTSPRGEGPHKNPPIEQHIDFYSSPVELGHGKEWTNWLQDMKRALRTSKPSLCVSKKTSTKALPAMIRTMKLLNEYCLERKSRKLRWAIIDDESDQVTVSGSSDAATPPQLYEVASIGECVYVSYSATPQANLFAPMIDPKTNKPMNQLFPKHFCFMLRASHFWTDRIEHPHDEVCYPVHHLNGMYCGGWTFHNWCSANSIADFFHKDVPTEPSFESQNLKEPFVHYLVTGAIRWLMQDKPTFSDSPQPPGTVFPDAHSMLINPATQTVEHWKYASMLINIIRAADGDDEFTVTRDNWNDGTKTQKSTAATMWESARTRIPMFVSSERDIFDTVYQDLAQSYSDVENIRNPHAPRAFPDSDDVLIAIGEISRNLNLRVLNGNTDDRLQYDIRSTDSGESKIPEDVYTIAIGGNNLGRGITLSGLCTTLFLTNRGADDTDVQKQRWFGYRGSHLEFVKVYCPTYVWQSNHPSTHEGLREKNETLMKLYELIVENWNNEIPPDLHHPAWSFAVGLASLISRKIPNIKILPQHKHNPIISWVSIKSGMIAKNTSAVNDLYNKMKTTKKMVASQFYHPVYKKDLGIMCGIPFDGDDGKDNSSLKNGDRFNLLEVADFLDSLSWEDHNPSKTPHPYQIPSEYVPNSLGKIPLYRKVSAEPPGDKIKSNDPYSIAAHLRLWHFLDLDNKKTPGTWPFEPAPEFNVIFREGTSTTKWKFPDGVEINLRKYDKDVTHNGQLTSYEWGSMNRTKSFGSNKNNDDVRESWPVGDGWRSFRSDVRPSGRPGMLQIRFIELSGGEKVPIVSLSIPAGGPSLAYV
jgi:hypothetical protein